MGNFTHIKVVAKYAARLGQCFSTTRAITGSRIVINAIHDVERDGWVFTDGVGKMSKFLATMVASELGLHPDAPLPSAFQFRLGGAKGIIVTCPESKGREIQMRKSQVKFQATYNGLEIIRPSRYSTAALNRQTITILSALGVEDEIFTTMLTEQLNNYQNAMEDQTLALSLLQRYIDDNHMTVVIAAMLLDGFMDKRDPFVLSLLHLWRSWSIKLLKEKAKIIVEKGAFLLGCIDETATLRGQKLHSPNSINRVLSVDELPQIFVQVPDRHHQDRYAVIEGVCLVGRNPSLHPGDLRVVRAVDIEALHHLRDVIVFPQLGERDVPSMCSGGDLDGDDYFVIWDETLTPKDWNVEPMNFTAPKAKELNRPIEIEDLMKFFVRYMKNDTLPTIAHAHLAQADFLDKGVRDPKCKFKALHTDLLD
jgi:RNA-dependent RNA polymerase